MLNLHVEPAAVVSQSRNKWSKGSLRIGQVFVGGVERSDLKIDVDISVVYLRWIPIVWASITG